MHINEVPNDKGDFRGRSDLKKVVYAIDDSGNYTTTNSDGWEVENSATKQAWDNVDRELAAIREDVLAGKLSPIPYYMHRCLMELSVLARYMGKWKWQIKRHFKPKRFNRLSAHTLQRYCSVFNISMEELKDVNYEKNI